MSTYRLLARWFSSTLLLLVFTFFITGCGTDSTTTSAAPTVTTTTAANCVRTQFQGATGTIQSIQGTTLSVLNQKGTTVQVSYTSSTRFTRQATVTPVALKDGTPVTVLVTKNADNTYSATTISLVNRAAFGSGFGNGTGRQRGNGSATPCANRSQNNTGNGGAFGGTGNARGIVGTVSQLSGNNLTVTDANGSDYSVQLTGSTKIMQATTASASDLKTGMKITATGSRTNGVLAARTITIVANS